jgi:hypothetical protein
MFDDGERHEARQQYVADHRIVLLRPDRPGDQHREQADRDRQQQREQRCRPAGVEIGFQMHDTRRHQAADCVARAQENQHLGRDPHAPEQPEGRKAEEIGAFPGNEPQEEPVDKQRDFMVADGFPGGQTGQARFRPGGHSCLLPASDHSGQKVVSCQAQTSSAPKNPA